jgi:succinyl-CoA synthetase alpha subunit
MGHAGAIISGAGGSAADKVAALRDAGIPVADRPVDIVDLVRSRMPSSVPKAVAWR